MSLDSRKDTAYGRSSFYFFSSEGVNWKLRQEVETSKGLVVCGPGKTYLRETSSKNSSAFAVNYENYVCTWLSAISYDSLNILIWPVFLLGMRQNVPFMGVLIALGAALMRGRRLQVSCCLCLAYSSSLSATAGRWSFCCFIFLSPVDFIELCLSLGKAAGLSSHTSFQ